MDLLGIFVCMVLLWTIIGITSVAVCLTNYLTGSSSSYGSVWFKWLLYPFLMLTFALAELVALPTSSDFNMVAVSALVYLLIGALCIYIGRLLVNHSRIGSRLLQLQGLMIIVQGFSLIIQ